MIHLPSKAVSFFQKIKKAFVKNERVCYFNAQEIFVQWNALGYIIQKAFAVTNCCVCLSA
jgi:hypothetical protein